MLGFQVALLSEAGGRRYNEDACGHWHSERDLVAVLCDGAGGHGGGDLAAKLAVSHLVHAFADAPSAGGAALNALLRDTSRAVIEARVPDTQSAHMHATAVCLVLDFVNHRAHWAHAGDSRLYWFRGGRLLERTRDHSMVQSLVDAGMLTPADLRHHPKRSELRSALGTEARLLQVDDSGAAREVAAGDVFLLCTDGVWEHLEEPRFAELLAAAATPHEWLAAIEGEVERATAALKSHDNFTALAVWTRDASDAIDADATNA
jgi:serine/threonine protein phosphatase PrpC